VLNSPSLFACGSGKDGVEPPFPVTMAFQPAVSILGEVTDQNHHALDQQRQVKAITRGIRLMREYLFAKPAPAALPPFSLPGDRPIIAGFAKDATYVQ
jgi:hypothetical protein